MVLPCEHHEACQYRYLKKGLRKKFCLACIVEKFPDCELFSETYKKKWGMISPKKADSGKFISVKPKPEVVTSKEPLEVEKVEDRTKDEVKKAQKSVRKISKSIAKEEGWESSKKSKKKKIVEKEDGSM